MANDLIKMLKADPLLKDFNIIKENAIAAYSYSCEKKNCMNCKGLENCQNASRGMEPFFDGFDVTYKSCKYLSKETNKENVNYLYMEDYDKTASFEGFETTSEARSKALKFAVNFVNTYPKNDGKGLFLYGKFGAGKTYFCSALANELAQKGAKVIVCYMPDLARTLKGSFEDKTFEQKVSQLKNCDVLILDDLGGEMMTPWFRDEILAPIIQHRLVAELPLFISSNLDFSQLQSHFAQTKDKTDVMKASRIIERILKMCVEVDFMEKYGA